MAKASDGVPATTGGARGDSRGAVAAATRHRAVALLGQAFDILEGKRRGDFVDALAQRAIDDPISFLERAETLCGKASGETKPGGNTFNLNDFGGLFAGAAAVAADRLAARAGDDAVVIDGVHSGLGDTQPTDW